MTPARGGLRQPIGACVGIVIFALTAHAAFGAVSDAPGVDVWLARTPDAYQVNFSFGSAAIEPANVDASKVHLVVVDDRQHVALSAEHFHAELPGIVVTKRWGPGSAGSTDNFDGGSEFTIEGIERADWPTDFAAIGEFSYRFDSDTAFSDARPIVVALARAPQTFADGGSGETMGAGGLGAACAGFSTRFADRWDFERALSRLPMRAAHPEWGAAVLDHMQKGEVRIGMTHEQIAWMFGYPPVYGTREALERLPT